MVLVRVMWGLGGVRCLGFMGGGSYQQISVENTKTQAKFMQCRTLDVKYLVAHDCGSII